MKHSQLVAIIKRLEAMIEAADNEESADEAVSGSEEE